MSKMTADEIQTLINQTCDTILNGWTTDAAANGIDTADYIDAKLDELETTDIETRLAVGRRYVQRLMGVAA